MGTGIVMRPITVEFDPGYSEITTHTEWVVKVDGFAAAYRHTEASARYLAKLWEEDPTLVVSRDDLKDGDDTDYSTDAIRYMTIWEELGIPRGSKIVLVDEDGSHLEVPHGEG